MNGIEVTPLVNSSLGQGKLIIVDMINDKEDIVMYLQNLLRKERIVHPQCKDYLSKIRSIARASDIDPVNEKWRRKLCEWCYEVTDHFKCKYYRRALAVNSRIMRP
jgi:RNase P subunit RPR2